LGYELHICDLWIDGARGVVGVALDEECKGYGVKGIRGAGVRGICGGYSLIVDSGAVRIV
jgi:hypothetical protein